MRAVIQRVRESSVLVEGAVVGSIGHGLCAMVGVAADDLAADRRWLAEKVAHARIFADEQGKMNRSVLDVGGQVLAISQFTLLGDLRTGRRPSFSRAMVPHAARLEFEGFCAELRSLGLKVETGRFQTEMEVRIVNEGPVTLLLDSKKTF